MIYSELLGLTGKDFGYKGDSKGIDEFGNINYYSYTVGGQKEVFALQVR